MTDPSKDIRLPGCSLDLRRGTLVRQGRTLTSRRQVVHLLAYLAAHKNEVVSREELAHALWPDGRGSDGALNFCVARAREVLRKLPAGHLVTIRHRGYCLNLDAPRGGIWGGADVSSEVLGLAPELPQQRAPLLERESQLRRLKEQLSEAQAWRQPRVTLVTAPAGYGKTALGRALAADATGRGIATVWSACVEGQEHPPGWPWPDVIESLHVETRRRQRCHSASSELDYHAYAIQALRTLEDSSDGKPLLIVLDNMHEADELAIRTCQHVLTRGFSAAVHLLLLLRSGLGKEEAVVLRTLRSQATEMSLAPLSRDASRTLIRRHHPGLPPKVEDLLVEAAGGIPLFLIKGCTSAANTSIGGRPAMELGLAHVLSAQLHSLPHQAQRLLGAAALVGEHFRLPLVAAALDWPLSDAVRRVEAVVDAGIVRETSTSCFRFTSTLFQRHVLQQMPGPERADMHWRLGMALTRSPRGLTTREQAAFHLSRGACNRAQASTAFDACVDAGCKCLESNKFADAALILTDALEVSDMAQSPPKRMLHLLRAASLALGRAGQALKAREYAREALDLADAQAANEDYAHAALCIAQTHANRLADDDSVLMVLRGALKRVHNESAQYWRLLLALIKTVPSHHVEQLSAFASDAKRSASIRLSGVGAAHLQQCTVLVHWNIPSMHEQHIQRLEQARRCLDEVQHAETVAEVEMLRVAANLRLGRVREVWRGMRGVQQIEGLTGFTPAHHELTMTSAALAVFRGDPRAADCISRAHELGSRITPEAATEVASAQRLLLAMRDASPASLSNAATATPARVWSTRVGRLLRGMLYAIQGDDAESRGPYQDQTRNGLYDPDANEDTGLVALKCELAAHHGDMRYAEQALDALTPYASHLATIGRTAVIVGPLGYSLGCLAACLDQRSKARELYQYAARTAAALGAPHWVDRCRRAAARLEHPRVGEPWRIRSDQPES